ncbi:hypothetical protein SAMN02745181_0476 [Rubritalea squalenifaciens DSM 18772]|uniref:Uncharacterized protein n=1 Tax=Rubritalea squalenifaciens DSM 18772 TaxID=1123071 RepID=A0A1M6CH74_9BACT|nr:hypothetical protein [Rubritalea squalenifaciens]SHI60201.1 hypothetical protein SAMN02745181_0476 [Rubritalea squalenifaciens DSM 18772]
MQKLIQTDRKECTFGADEIIGYLTLLPEEIAKINNFHVQTFWTDGMGDTELIYLVAPRFECALFRYVMAPQNKYTAIAVDPRKTYPNNLLSEIVNALNLSSEDILDVTC